MDTVSRERLTPAAAAEAVTPTVPLLYVSACDGGGLPPHVSHENVHGRAGQVMTRQPFHSEGLHRACIPYPPCQPPEDGSGGWWSSAPASSTSVPPSTRLLLVERSVTRALTPWRVPIACITPPVGTRPPPRPRKFRGSLMFFLSTAAWEDLRNVFPNSNAKVSPSPPRHLHHPVTPPLRAANSCPQLRNPTSTGRFPWRTCP